jgi:hypothetical protein
MPMLTTEENQTLMAALQKAQLDPAVKAANEKKQQAIAAARAVMIAKDPSLAPLLDKILPTSSPAPGTPRPILTADERMQWSAAQQAIQGTPEADAVLKARLDYARALHSAMLAADPAVAAIFDKLPQNGMVAHPHSAAAASPAPSAQ